MTEAKGEAIFIIEPTNADINASNGFTVRKRFQDVETTTTYTTDVSQMFDDVLDQISRPTASSSGMKGGLIFLKNGTYEFDGTDHVEFSDSTDAASVHIRLIGETRDNTIINAGNIVKGPPQDIGRILRPLCSLDVENITIDGNNNQNVFGIHPDDTVNAAKILKVKNCRFTNVRGFDIINGGNQFGTYISECKFDNHQNFEDQIAVGADDPNGFCIVHDNLFDKTNQGGSSITSGGGYNFNIHNNIILRQEGFPIYGISLEAFHDYGSIFIHHNYITNGRIHLGGPGDYDFVFPNTSITSNVLYQGGIDIEGPLNGMTNGEISNVLIENNQLFDSWDFGIRLTNIGSMNAVRNNMIKNSNKLADPDVGQQGLIFLEKCKDSVVENNSLYMSTLTPADSDFCPQGIRYAWLDNPTIRNNRILNRTVANPSYQSIEPHTGTILISRNT